jgi:cell fate regulator YaaT (PSP1 superfamily)
LLVPETHHLNYFIHQMACLGCTSCGTGKDGKAGGCGSNGGCATGGCNRHNTFDWITALGINDSRPYEFVEVSFKNGSRKEFYKNPSFTRTTTGDHVLVESAAGGYDIGKISLSGELVRLQMKRKKVKNEAKLGAVVRKAHDRDLERLDEVRRDEKNVMVKARTIARTLDLDMKVCDVEFQGDGRKCTFFYTADGRVDFRELIRHYAREFKVKIEMRQIGARQESARIGGLGNCGRELCCSTWLSEFKSVNTAAARYQNLAINQTKLSGMCGRLKCCLNYELDTYIDALEDFPDKADRLKTGTGTAILVKTDVFKRLMFYTYIDNRSKFYALHVDQVWDALELIKNGTPPGSLDDIQAMAPPPDEPEEEVIDFENVQDVLQLPIEKRKKKKKKKKGRGDSAAAAVERADQAEQQRSGNQGKGQHGGRGPRPDQRNNKSQGGPKPPPRTDQRGPNPQRPPQQLSGGQPQGNNKGQQQPPKPQDPKNRPPQQGGGGQQQGGNKGQQQPPKQQGNKPPGGGQQGGQNNPNRPPQQAGNKPPKHQGGGKGPDKKERDDKPPGGE